MKIYTFLSLVAVIMFSCNKENNIELLYHDYVLAGIIPGSSSKGMLYTKIRPVPRILDDNFLDLPIYDSYTIDINDDGTEDYKFVRSRAFDDDYDSLRIELTPLGRNELAMTSYNSGFIHPTPLTDTLNSTYNWVNNTGIIYNVYINQTETTKLGLWQNEDHKYVGVRTIVDDEYLYGWIGISVSEAWGDDLVVFDYATTIGFFE